MTAPDKLRATAFHEAGHAIVGMHLGIEIGGASIRAGTSRGVPTNGHVLFLGGSPIARGIMAEAASIAQARVDRMANISVSATQDREDVEASIDEYFRLESSAEPSARDRLVVRRTVRSLAERFVEEHWPQITHMADLLIDREEVTGDEIARVPSAQRGATRRLPDALPMQSRLQPLGSGAIDTEARTVTLVFTTGATVRRNRYVGWDAVVPFDESLVVSREAIDLGRLNAGAPVLDSHAMYSTASQIAVVERAWIDGSEGKATVRFPKAGIDPQADRLFGLVADRIVKNVSVGYSVDQVRIVEATKRGEVEQHIVERWTPFEISFVTVGADAGAQVRSADTATRYPIAFSGLRFTPGPASAALVRMQMRSTLADLTDLDRRLTAMEQRAQ